MTSIRALRTFIDALEDAGQLARIAQPVSMQHELADVGAALERAGAAAGLFERPEDSPWPIFCGGVASGRRVAIALGCQPTEIVDVMEHVLEPAHGIGPVMADVAPWQANTVEWSAPTPVPHGNFPVAPVVYRGPYEYSSPEVTEDWLPQTKKLETQAASAH